MEHPTGLQCAAAPAACAQPAAPRAWLGGWWCAGALLGVALQLQQPRLWGAAAYAALGLLALLVGWRAGWSGRRGRAVPPVVVALAAALLVFSATGLRALQRQAQVLDPALEGRDVRIVATVAAMPQPLEAGVRLRVAIESALLAGQPVRLPERIDLGWYDSQGSPPDAADAPYSRYAGLPRAGERWALTVRLRAPHGARNPQGFDYELWLWEQGVGATGTVRARAPGDAPQRLAQTAWHPVERLRQRVRDAVFDTLAPDAGDAQRQRLAGVVAALVTGDQRAIELVTNNTVVTW